MEAAYIFMGDIIYSRHQDAQKLMYTFKKSTERLNKSQAQAFKSPITITLGDEFQAVCTSYQACFEVALTLDSLLKNAHIACRYVLAKGTIDTDINTQNAWEMLGRGLTHARKRLNDKKDPNRFRFLVDESEEQSRILSTLGYAISDIRDTWTDRQRELIEIDQNHEGLEEKLTQAGTQKASYYESLRSGRIHLYRDILGTIDMLLRKL